MQVNPSTRCGVVPIFVDSLTEKSIFQPKVNYIGICEFMCVENRDTSLNVARGRCFVSALR